MAISDYRFDPYGRPVHRDLDDLAVRITEAMQANGGRLEMFELPVAEYMHLEREQAYFNGGASVAMDYGRHNFAWRGIPVCPLAPTLQTEGA